MTERYRHDTKQGPTTTCLGGRMSDLLRIEDADRIRVVTFDRPHARNAFNEALYDAVAEAVIATAADRGIAVLVFTGVDGSFSAGTDLFEMAGRTSGATVRGQHGFA